MFLRQKSARWQANAAAQRRVGSERSTPSAQRPGLQFLVLMARAHSAVVVSLRFRHRFGLELAGHRCAGCGCRARGVLAGLAAALLKRFAAPSSNLHGNQRYSVPTTKTCACQEQITEEFDCCWR